MKKYKAILFDLYDTLIWLDLRESDLWRQRFADRIGIRMEQFMSAWRRSMDDRMLGKGGGLDQQIASTLSELGVVSTDELIRDLVEIERRRLECSVKPYPDVEPVLRRLASDGYRLGLLSNASDGAAIPLTYLGLDRLFHTLILSHEVGLLKPDPAIYHLACQRLGVEPTETVFVADGGFGELDSACALGILAVMIEQPNQSRDYGYSTRYDAKISDLQGLDALLESTS